MSKAGTGAPLKPRSARRKKPAKRGKSAASILQDPEHFFNREWSWMDFDSRVLALAASPHIPLLERIKFLSITSTNLDEFFMVRVAGLKEQARTRTLKTGADGFTPQEQLDGISRRVRELMKEQSRLWQKELQPQLAKAGIDVVGRHELSPADMKFVKKYFARQVFPVLTPMAVDPAHPFPHLPNKSLSLCVILKPKEKDPVRKRLYAFVEIPQVLPRFVALKPSSDKTRFVLLDDVIALHLPKLFGGSEVLESFAMRITRDSDLEIDDEEAEDLLTVVEAELRQRQWGNAVRLEISSRAPDEAVRFLREMLEIDGRDVLQSDGPLNFGDWMALTRLPGYNSLRYEPFVPQVRPGWRRAASVFDYVRSGDVLVHHPYESFSAVSDFLETAASDPQVLA
ncbi:MAG: hypothetical protein K1X53_02470, partial [Candidatus Sumerlaeaceae bacterium]|nr:hypothetical protein [Candidatus Sumerlaeaceae bacterium]